MEKIKDWQEKITKYLLVCTTVAAWAPVILFIGMLLYASISCAATQAVTKDPYRVGRLTAITYLSTQEKLSDDQRQAIRLAYMALEFVSEGQDLVGLDKAAKEWVVEKTDNVALRVAAIEAIDFYWAELQMELLDKPMGSAAQQRIIREFHRGIRTALADYGGN